MRYLLEAEAVTGECLTVDCGEQYGHVRERFTDTATDRGDRRAGTVEPGPQELGLIGNRIAGLCVSRDGERRNVR